MWAVSDEGILDMHRGQRRFFLQVLKTQEVPELPQSKKSITEANLDIN